MIDALLNSDFKTVTNYQPSRLLEVEEGIVGHQGERNH